MSAPPTCRVDELTVDGCPAVRLANGLVRVDVLPTLGGKIWNLWDLCAGRQWIWHNPAVRLRPLAPGAPYDSNWAGGWEELFPNDAPGVFLDRDLPDHGEWWSAEWHHEVTASSEDRVEVRLWRAGTATPTACQKWITLDRHSAAVSVRYSIENLTADSLYFLFKQHLALSVDSGCRIELPGGTVTPVDPAFGTRATTTFPWKGGPVDLGLLSDAAERHRDFVYVTGMPAGWCGVCDQRQGTRLRLRYSLVDFPYTWLFITLGGWGGLYTVVLEPCTNMPKDLTLAHQLGQCGRLEPSGTFECAVTAELSRAEDRPVVDHS